MGHAGPARHAATHAARDAAPRVSVVVPLSGDPEAALRCLVALSEVPDDPAHEVVIVDDASVGLGPLLERVGGDALLVRRPERGGLLRAWASGLERASGEIVVLLAGPVAVDPGFLAPLAAALADPRTAAATAGVGDPVATAALALRRAVGPLLGLGRAAAPVRGPEHPAERVCGQCCSSACSIVS
ncbi:glycosyltransferase [Patulibacter sp. NPDC049589]|uniref:glycosyltransferase family 2 protein n=1 Tax=Patulibacter sp. NPDC049589 TaxID=3154731 RepID=UPI003438BDBE